MSLFKDACRALAASRTDLILEFWQDRARGFELLSLHKIYDGLEAWGRLDNSAGFGPGLMENTNKGLGKIVCCECTDDQTKRMLLLLGQTPTFGSFRVGGSGVVYCSTPGSAKLVAGVGSGRAGHRPDFSSLCFDRYRTCK